MQIKELYRYSREGGGVTVSPEKPECEHEVTYRIIADEGKEVTQDGVNTFCCVDTHTNEGWYEVDAVTEEMSEIEEKAKAYDIMTGVAE